MATKNKTGPFLRLWILVLILLVCIVYQFVEINKLDSKNLKNEISKVEKKQDELQNNLNSVVITQTKNDSTLSKQIATFQNQLTELQAKYGKFQNQLTELQAKYDSNNSNYYLGWISILLFLVLFVLVILPYMFIFSLPTLDNQKGKTRSGKMTTKLKKFIVFVSESNRIKSESSNNTQHKISVNTQVSSNDSSNLKQESTKEALQTVSEETIETHEPVTKYLGGKQGKTFSVYSVSEGNFFKLQNETAETAEFIFWGNEKEAIAKRVFSDDICEIVSGNPQNAQLVKTNKPGALKKNGDRWEVKDKIRIKFE
jgi:hypothetical protein